MVHVRAIYSSVEDVGKTMKKTKKHYLWKFQINEREHILELYASTLSRKKKIVLNGNKVYKDQKVLTVNFFHQLLIDHNTVHVYLNNDKFDILINNEPFQRFYSDDFDTKRDDYSYRASKSMVTRVTDKYHHEKRLRNNLERDDFAPRAKFNGDKYYTNQESIESWNDVEQKKSHSNKNSGEKDYHRSQTNLEEHYVNVESFFQRKGSIEDHDYRDHEPREKSTFEGFGTKPQPHTNHHTQSHNPQLHHSKSVIQKPVSTFSPPQNNAHKVTPTQNAQTPVTQNTVNFFDFAESQVISPPKTEQTVATSTIQKQTSAPPSTISNDLLDLSNAFTNITDLYKQAPPQPEQVKTEEIQPAPEVQLMTQVADPNKKNDLWGRNDLIDLTSFGNKENEDPNKKNEFVNFKLPTSGMNIMPSSTNSFATMNTMSTNMNNMNNSMNTMNSMNNMNNMSNMNNMGMGYMGGMQQFSTMGNSNFGNPMMNGSMGFQTNNMGMGMNMGMGGFGNQGMGYGMNQFQGAYTGFGTNY